MSGVSGARAHLSYFQPESLILAMCHVFKLARVAKRDARKTTAPARKRRRVLYDTIVYARVPWSTAVWIHYTSYSSIQNNLEY